ncbi:MAG: ferrochelatase [Proteobacteria bacterium]|nr:ferrochelatase [Pseudomonadota bacterium]
MAKKSDAPATLIKRCTTPLLLASVILSGCKTGGSSGSSTNLASTNEGITVAVLLASHGDIDDTKGELEDYIKTAFKHNVGIPLPYWARPAVTQPAYMLSVKNVKSQYDIIGPTHYRENSQKQIEALALALKEAGISARTYYGFNFAKPYISETMAQMQKDGIKKIIVYNQGAQCSWASQGENIGDVREYMKEHPEYDAEVIGYRQYSEDQRFRDLMVDVVTRDAQEKFPGVSASQICVLIGSHGLPVIMTDAGDPAIGEMNRAFDYMVTKMKPYRLYHGFLNDDFIPGAKWAQPPSSDVATTMRDDGCRNILLDGRLSFTVNHRATLYDLNYVARNILETKDDKINWQANLTWKKPKVELANHFDGDPGLAKLIATLTKEALARNGDIEVIKELGQPVTPAPKKEDSCKRIAP